MWNFVSKILNAVLPPHTDAVLAESLSERDIIALASPRRCDETWITALFSYREPKVRALIRAIKYHGETKALATVSRILGEYVLETISDKKSMSGWKNPLLVPIPASERRKRERGYAQAERIARALLPFIEGAVVFAPEALAREERESQVNVPREKRGENIQNAFFVLDSTKVHGQFVILIDDVSESGSTLRDAKRALMQAGAKDVIAIVVAH